MQESLARFNRGLEVEDARRIYDTHSRAAHTTAALPRSTCNTSHFYLQSNLYDLFLSSAADSIVHLCDVRADNCLMRFCETLIEGIAFSAT
ncbi:hypothetical protein PsorP6_002086 [Peronosclerospora sorghi]|uniref:Uncharacterized protein n=1 Tax=Peronosclerospora sorghi TaxID=230839 RepID=A0ACC0WU87_9STRA|nr:hypothetical protein PsorP6_002086 [Peronosclerospora sorghi]